MANKAKVNKVTAIALMEIMSTKEVVELSGISQSQLYKLKQGNQAVAYLPSELDKEFIASMGLKICQACGVRLVPTKPVRYQILTRLCESCWSGEMGEENYELILPPNTTYDNSISSQMSRKSGFPDEIFKEIPGYPRYNITNYGRVYDFFYDCYAKFHVTLNRTLLVILQEGASYGPYGREEPHNEDGKSGIGKLVHNLVLEAFVGPCPPGHKAHHKNGVPSDNQMRKGIAENLEWRKE